MLKDPELCGTAIEQAMVKGVTRAIPAMMIFLLIGVLIGVWIVAGVVPSLLYYGMQILSPDVFLPLGGRQEHGVARDEGGVAEEDGLAGVADFAFVRRSVFVRHQERAGDGEVQAVAKAALGVTFHAGAAEHAPVADVGEQ